MTKHTPGPWTLKTVKTSVGVCHKIGEFPGSVVHPVTYGCVYEDGSHYWRTIDRMDTELLANARLMAAAPDLLDALKEYVLWHGAVHSDECPADDTCDCIGKSINDKVNAAMRKAEGAEV